MGSAFSCLPTSDYHTEVTAM